MMIAQAELAKDTFAVWGFNSGGFEDMGRPISRTRTSHGLLS